jgi:hypothetical protein
MIADRLKARIREQGPLSIANFMTEALFDPVEGYYATKDPIGAGSDFITAPEVSQMFGELVGLFVLQSWVDLGRPERVHLIELGPGRGTMMSDVLRPLPDHFRVVEQDIAETAAGNHAERGPEQEVVDLRLVERGFGFLGTGRMPDMRAPAQRDHVAPAQDQTGNVGDRIPAQGKPGRLMGAEMETVGTDRKQDRVNQVETGRADLHDISLLPLRFLPIRAHLRCRCDASARCALPPRTAYRAFPTL